jgi:hypothetical protein
VCDLYCVKGEAILTFDLIAFADDPSDPASVICLPCTHLLGIKITLVRKKRAAHERDVARHLRALPAWRASLEASKDEGSLPARLALARDFVSGESSASLADNPRDSPLTQQSSFPDLVEHPDHFENLDGEPILFSAAQLDEDNAVAQLTRDYDALALYDHTTFSSNTGRDRNRNRGEDATIASALAAMDGTGLSEAFVEAAELVIQTAIRRMTSKRRSTQLRLCRPTWQWTRTMTGAHMARKR